MLNIFHSIVCGIIYPYSLAVERCKVKSWTGLFIPLTVTFSFHTGSCSFDLQIIFANGDRLIPRGRQWTTATVYSQYAYVCDKFEALPKYLNSLECVVRPSVSAKDNVSGPWLLLEHWDTWARSLNSPSNNISFPSFSTPRGFSSHEPLNKQSRAPLTGSILRQQCGIFQICSGLCSRTVKSYCKAVDMWLLKLESGKGKKRRMKEVGRRKTTRWDFKSGAG